MNWDQVEGSWKTQKGKIMSKWGKRTALLGLLQSRYGRAKDQDELEIDMWIEKLN